MFQLSFNDKSYNLGTLYIVATPIGNLNDITFRAKSILSSVDLILCEDTRNTSYLLNNLKIKNNIESYHKFNENKSISKILDLLINNKNIALVSDAGLPLISDPGSILVNELIKNKINIVPIPGPSAFTSALVCSGLNTSNFFFYGFLKNKTNIKKQQELELLKNYPTTIIFYESPKRLLDTLNNIKIIFGDIKICVAKELTKLYESFYRGYISEVIENIKNHKERILGEFVILIENNENIKNEATYKKIKSEIDYLIKKYTTLTNRDIIELVSYKLNINKRIVYKTFNKENSYEE